MEEKKYLLDELDELSPMLKAMKAKEKNSGPDPSYFDNLQEKVISQIKLDIASKPETLSDVPSEYFEKLPDFVLAKVNKNEAKQVTFAQYRKWIGLAASLIVVLIALPFVTRQLKPTESPLASNTKVAISESIANDLTDEDIDYIIHRYGSDEDLDMIKTMDVDKSALSIESINTDDVDVNLTEEDLQYLNSIM